MIVYTAATTLSTGLHTAYTGKVNMQMQRQDVVAFLFAGQSHAFAICSTRGFGLTVHEAALANIRVATDQECAGIGVNGWKPAHMLPHLLQVAQAGRLLLHDCAHAPLQHNVCHCASM